MDAEEFGPDDLDVDLVGPERPPRAPSTTVAGIDLDEIDEAEREGPMPEARNGTHRRVADRPPVAPAPDPNPARADRLSSSINAVTWKLDALAADQKDLASAISGLVNRLDGLDQRAHSQGAPPVDLSPTVNGISRLEAKVGSLLAGDNPADEEHRVALVMRRLEQLEATLTARLAHNAAAVRTISEAIERPAAQVPHPPPSPDRVGLAAVTRLEEHMGRLSRQLERTGIENGPVDEVLKTVSRMAFAQAEDLERILDRVERIGQLIAENTDRAVRLSRLDQDRMTRVETALLALGGQQARASIGDQVEALTEEVHALRHRLVMRRRAGQPDDSDATGELADTIVARLVSARLNVVVAAPPADVGRGSGHDS